MVRYRVQINDAPPITAGAEHANEGFSISLLDTVCGEAAPNGDVAGPKVFVASGSSVETNGIVMKVWVDQHVHPGSTIQIQVLDEGEIAEPIRVDSRPNIKDFCIICRKPSDDVAHLVESPDKTICMCDNCINWFGDRLK